MKIEDLPRPANYRRQMAKNGGYEMVPAYTAEEILGIVTAQWQPIETAPKDGTAILVSEGRFIHCVEWNDEYEWWAVDDNKLGPFRLRGTAPTHWMPLPKAP